jgi:hypothetical protein
LSRLPFGHIWCCDTEFVARDGSGEPPIPVCVVFEDAISGCVIRLWQDDLGAAPPQPLLDPDACFVAYSSTAEFAVFQALGWPVPANVVDFFAEHRCSTNTDGEVPFGNGLIGALASRGLGWGDAEEKPAMIELILSGGPWSGDERRAILDYCQRDVTALVRLAPLIFAEVLDRHRGDPERGLAQALHRGEVAKVVAKMEARGIPMDGPLYRHLRCHWGPIRRALAASVADLYPGVYNGTVFKKGGFERWLAGRGLLDAWERGEDGQITVGRDFMREMAALHPELGPLVSVRSTLSSLNDFALPIGRDGRNRARLKPFMTKTCRNAPSSTDFVFTAPSWMRGLIVPPGPDGAVLYLDYSSQELVIMAALAGDAALLETCFAGDPYLDFAVRAGLAPEGATKETHAEARAHAKALLLGVQFGMGAHGLARRAKLPLSTAHDLLDRHRAAYPKVHAFIRDTLHTADLTGELRNRFGWRITTQSMRNPREVQNWPIQSTGSMILHWAMRLLDQAGLRLVATVHDAVLLEAPRRDLTDAVAAASRIMRQASADVIGVEIGVDWHAAPDPRPAVLGRWPERAERLLLDKGEALFRQITALLREVEAADAADRSAA